MNDALLWLNGNSGWIQVVSLSAGIVYMIMQVLQHRMMWYFDLITAGAALLVAVSNMSESSWAPLWAQVLMNAYFIVMAVAGIFTWRKLDGQTDAGKIHIVKLTRRKMRNVSVAALVAMPAICSAMFLTNDPSPVADGLSLLLSLIAAWFLTCSHIEQWIMWIAADLLAIVVYAEQGAWWMVALYYCYIVSSCIGLVHWRNNAVWVNPDVRKKA